MAHAQPVDPNLRAAQALSILQALEQLPPGRSMTLVHLPSGGWGASLAGADHRGESATDALGQLTCVMALSGDKLCERCEKEPAAREHHDMPLCEGCYDTLGELQDERRAAER